MPRRNPLRLAALCTAAWLIAPLAQAHITAKPDVNLIEELRSGDTIEMVFVAWDGNGSTTKLQYVQDLGITLGDFRVSGQQDSGSSLRLWLGGATTGNGFQAFLNTDLGGGVTVDPTKVRWAVVGYDTTVNGSNIEPGALNLFTTLKQGVSGSPDTILGLSDMIGDQLDNAASSYELWIGDVNFTGTHPTSANGWSINSVSDTNPPRAFAFLSGGAGDTAGNLDIGRNLPRPIGNLMGQSSWFYAVTPSDEFDSTIPVTIDEFDNLEHDAYWGLAASTDPDHPGEYLLSYTLPAITSAAEAAAGITFGNTFARIAGLYSLSSPAGKAESTLSLTEGFLRGLAQQRLAAAAPSMHITAVLGDNGLLDAPLPAVPEPGAAWLLLAGLGLGAPLLQRRRRGTAEPR